jgi:integrase
MRNPNHPVKGSVTKVDPITNPKNISLIKKMLADKPRDLCLFVMGINTNLRASDLARITAGQVRHLTPATEDNPDSNKLVLKEKKTKKERRITLNKAVIGSIQQLLTSRPYEDKDPLFVSRKGNKALSVPSINRLVKTWCKDINLKGNYGSHTLRKTFGYQHRQRGVSIPLLMEMFNHSTQKQTLDYLCIQPEELDDVYMDEI